jgi:hypothetical protein
MAFQKLESRTKGFRRCDFTVGRLGNAQDINPTTPKLHSNRFANALTSPGNHNTIQIVHSEAFLSHRVKQHMIRPFIPATEKQLAGV